VKKNKRSTKMQPNDNSTHLGDPTPEGPFGYNSQQQLS